MRSLNWLLRCRCAASCLPTTMSPAWGTCVMLMNATCRKVTTLVMCQGMVPVGKHALVAQLLGTPAPP